MPSLQFIGSATEYDVGGIKPCAAYVIANWAVEVHQDDGNAGPLSYFCGQPGWLGERPTIYESNGASPALAGSGVVVAEVHQAGTGVGPLWYRTGNFLALGRLMWQDSFKFEDVGFRPSVGLASSRAVEVHQGGAGFGSIWHRTGVEANGRISWSNSTELATGMNPAVAISPDGTTVAVVFQDMSDNLLYVCGTWQSTGVQWSNQPMRYDSGASPSIAIAPPYGQNKSPTIVEVHQGQDGAGPLWYRTGTLAANGVTWDDSHQYDTGFSPAVAVNAVGAGIEVHAVNTGLAALWSHGFQLQ